MTVKKKKRRLFVILLCLAVFFEIGLNIYLNNNIKITKYSLESGFIVPVRIVQLTDLHNKEFGQKNIKLINAILGQNPDIVVMTGDMLIESEEDISVITALINDLSKNVSVYFSMGNHEVVYEKNYNGLRTKIENAGAVVLNYEYQDIVINGNDIRIGGYYGFYRTPHMDTQNREERTVMNKFCNDFENTERYKLLLCHIPTTWLDWNRIDDFPIDLVICGHYHGGQIRIPFIGGLHAPYVGWFPKYTKGLFVGTKASCVLSTGLGESSSIPRINNPPEIVVIDLK